MLEADFDTVQWFVVHTSANHEKQVAAQFSGREIEHFLPLYESVRVWSDRRVKLQRPLFPGYLFVKTALRGRLPILQTPGVVRLVGPGNQPSPIDTALIEALRDGLGRVAVEPHPYLVAGQRIRVSAGPLRGMEGVLLRRKSGARVVISIDLIQKSFAADVDINDVVPIGRNRTASLPDTSQK